MHTEFFERQSRARRNAWAFLLIYCVVLFVLSICVNLLLWGALKVGVMASFISDGFVLEALSVNTFFLLCLVGGGAWFKARELREEGPISIVLSIGGKLIDPSFATDSEKRLINIVQEISIASGSPVPEVFVLEKEEGINAFAAGFTPSDSVIVVTQGAIDLLDREELQSVVAHEFSHILNEDVGLKMKLHALLHGFFLLSHLGRTMVDIGSGGSRRRYSKGDADGSFAFVAIGLVFLIFGGLCEFAGRILQGAIGREQEKLADASSVQFTRNVSGLVSALKKIGGWKSEVIHNRGVELNHFFFAAGQGAGFFSKYFATHPPLLERIQEWEPQFRGKYEVLNPEALTQLKKNVAIAISAAAQTTSKAMKRAEEQRVREKKRISIELLPASEVLRQVSQMPTLEQVEWAEDFLHVLPEFIQSALTDSYLVRAVIYGLLIEEQNRDVALEQMEFLKKYENSDVIHLSSRVAEFVKANVRWSKLALVDICMPQLKQLTSEQRKEFLAQVKGLIATDQKVSVFEFSIAKILIHHIDRQIPSVDFHSLRAVLPDVVCLLSVLAHFGNPDDEAQARASFKLGAARLKISERAFITLEQSDIKAFDLALRRIVKASPILKSKIFEACLYTCAADQQMKRDEMELLRVLATLFDRSMPTLQVASA